MYIILINDTYVIYFCSSVHFFLTIFKMHLSKISCAIIVPAVEFLLRTLNGPQGAHCGAELPIYFL